MKARILKASETVTTDNDSGFLRFYLQRTGATAEQFELTGESDSAQQEQPDEPSQWWWIIGILALVIILIGSAILMQYMNKKRKIKNLKEECNNVIENEKYIYNRLVIGYVRFDFAELNRLIYDENCVN